LNLMEVCGTHTMAIGRHGLRAQLPLDLRLISGPGCPVCVTPASDVDRAIALASEPGVTLASFGDLLRVPGSQGSLLQARARGATVRLVYSPLEALELAREQPRELVVFAAIGFETTAPAIAATLLRAAERGVDNFALLPACKLVPPAMQALADDPSCRIDGFICPGHVSAIIGWAPYQPIAARGAPCVITGFEALDILQGVAMLCEQAQQGRSEVECQYQRAVPREGNPAAQAVMARVFATCDAHWRGIGDIPGTGLRLRERFRSFDAHRRVPLDIPEAADLPTGCACGAVMMGRVLPSDCPLFGQACTPAHPVGPCMVSSEGACAAYQRYGA